MANHKSAEKRTRQTKTKTLRNKVRVSESRSLVKKMRTALEGKDKETATALLPKIQRVFARLAKDGITKDNTAARRTARIASQVAKL